VPTHPAEQFEGLGCGGDRSVALKPSAFDASPHTNNAHQRLVQGGNNFRRQALNVGASNAIDAILGSRKDVHNAHPFARTAAKNNGNSKAQAISVLGDAAIAVPARYTALAETASFEKIQCLTNVRNRTDAFIWKVRSVR
jgi:hypothetical protein